MKTFIVVDFVLLHALLVALFISATPAEAPKTKTVEPRPLEAIWIESLSPATGGVRDGFASLRSPGTEVQLSYFGGESMRLSTKALEASFTSSNRRATYTVESVGSDFSNKFSNSGFSDGLEDSTLSLYSPTEFLLLNGDGFRVSVDGEDSTPRKTSSAGAGFLDGPKSSEMKVLLDRHDASLEALWREGVARFRIVSQEEEYCWQWSATGAARCERAVEP